jgi:NAD(P)-dependent dehydrogenase (short-subunit alcohol dehydrogenase family)
MGGTYSQPREIETQWFNAFQETIPSLDGKVIAITGCTSGTGYVCARTCARKGAHVIMLNRASERADKAMEKIAIDAPGSKVTKIDCDLMDFDSVRAAAVSVNEKFAEQGIDVLCCNAGVMALEDKATKDGYDIQMQTNHLSHFLLAKEVFPLLEKAAELHGEARIVNHSSIARKSPGGNLEARYYNKNGGNLGGDSSSLLFGGRWQRYHQTKLANAVFTLALADKLAAKNSKVITACAAPGLASTNLQVTTASNGGFADAWMMRFAQSAEDGTIPLLKCCVDPEVKNGQFYEPRGMMALSGMPHLVQLEAICTRPADRVVLWEESEKACGAWVL